MPIKKKTRTQPRLARKPGCPSRCGWRTNQVYICGACHIGLHNLDIYFYCMYRERQWKGFQTSQIISVFSFSVSRPEVRRVWNDGQNSGTPLNVCLPYSGTPPRVKIHFFLGE